MIPTIYAIATIFAMITLAYIFGDMFERESSMYLVIVTFGAAIWPVTAIIALLLWRKWRRI
jgi:membrane protein DedA with SNARE-associated domain